MDDSDFAGKQVHWNPMDQHYTGSRHMQKYQVRVNCKAKEEEKDDGYVTIWCGIHIVLVFAIFIFVYLLYTLFHESH